MGNLSISSIVSHGDHLCIGFSFSQDNQCRQSILGRLCSLWGLLFTKSRQAPFPASKDMGKKAEVRSVDSFAIRKNAADTAPYLPQLRKFI